MSGTLRLRGSTSGYAELQAAAVAGDQTFILPAVGGTLLTTDSPVGNLTLELGSASQPSLRFEGDTDTGLFSSGANTLNLVTGGSNKLVLGATAHTIFSGTNGSVRALDIDSSGRLLIGMTSAPAGTDAQYTKFAIRGNTLNNNGSYLSLGNGKSTADTTNDDNLGIITFNDSDTDAGEYARIIGASDGANGTDDYPGKLVFSTTPDGGSSPTLRMKINNAGYVGIGAFLSTDPASLLHLKDASSPSLRLQDTTNDCTLLMYAQNSNSHIGTSSNHELFFDTDGSQKMMITTSGNVGINITNPSSKLHVNGTAKFDDYIHFGGVISTPQTAAAIYRPVDNQLAFSTANTERLRIDNNGRLLLRSGTTAASTLNGGFENTFQVEGIGATTSSISITRNSNDENPAYLNFGKSRGTSLGSNTIIQNNDTIAQIDFNASDGSNSFNPFASIRAQVDGTPGDGDAPGRLRFYTTADGSGSPDSNGRWTINRLGVLETGTVDSGYLSGAIKLNGSRKVVFGTGNAASIGIVAQGSGNAAVDTGISVNRGNAGGSAILLWNGNSSNGTNTTAAVYFIKFFYDGNNTPTLTLLSGNNTLSIGQSGSNTMTLTPGGNYNWTMTIFMGD